MTRRLAILMLAVLLAFFGSACGSPAISSGSEPSGAPAAPATGVPYDGPATPSGGAVPDGPLLPSEGAVPYGPPLTSSDGGPYDVAAAHRAAAPKYCPAAEEVSTRRQQVAATDPADTQLISDRYRGYIEAAEAAATVAPLDFQEPYRKILLSPIPWELFEAEIAEGADYPDEVIEVVLAASDAETMISLMHEHMCPPPGLDQGPQPHDPRSSL